MGKGTMEKGEGKKNREWEQETLSTKYSFLNLRDYLVTLTLYTYYIYYSFKVWWDGVEKNKDEFVNREAQK